MQLTTNQWKIVTLCAVGGLFEMMDMYVIGFILAGLTKPWHLNYGQSATVLLASGIGAVLGSLVWGQFSDIFGRKIAFIGTLFVCSAASLALALTPDGNWIYLAALRAVLGFGTGGFFIFIAYAQEFLPANNRGFGTAIVSTAAAGGLLLGSAGASFLMPIIGWRGLFAIGTLPAALAVIAHYLVPESPRWSMSHGDKAGASRSLTWALGDQADIDGIIAAHPTTALPPWKALLDYRSNLTSGMLINLGVVTGYYGMVLWAPTMIAQILGVPPESAAKTIMWMTIAGLLSRLTIGKLADHLGRKTCGAITAVGAGVALTAAGFVGSGGWLTPTAFIYPFALAFVLADSGFAVMGTYTAEIWPSRLRGRGTGACYAAGGIGKIIGPLGLALLIGSAKLITPAATVDAIFPAFAYLGSMFLLAAISYLFIARETMGVTFESLDRPRD